MSVTVRASSELITIGVILSIIVHSGVISLTLTYFPLLMETSHTMSRFMRNFLVVYVVVMTILSTVFMVLSVLSMPSTFEDDIRVIEPEYFITDFGMLSFPGEVFFVLASWGADGFMLWRCAVLYNGISKFSRWVVITVLFILGLASFGMGMICLTFSVRIMIPSNFMFIGVTITLNIVTAALIASRILYYQRYIRQTIGFQRDKPYTNVIVICVESSALIVICNIAYLIPAAINSGFIFITAQLLVHVYVISPILIAYRVATGKAVAIPGRLSGGGPISTLRFQHIRSLTLTPTHNEL